ncbi:MAG: type II secretion system F family protein [Planctomycetota bacterium]
MLVVPLNPLVGQSTLLPVEVMFVAFIVMPVALWILIRLLPSIPESVYRLFGGEASAMLPAGFLPRGVRIRRAIVLQSIISRLALITKLNLPLQRALMAGAADEPRWMGRIMKEVGVRVGAGERVSQALAGAFRGCPPQIVAALGKAESSGQLAAGLSIQERSLADCIEHHLAARNSSRQAFAYAALMLVIISALLGFCLYFIVPRLREIMMDFGVTMPAVTTSLLEFSVWLWSNVWVLLFVVALAAALVLVVGSSSMSESGSGWLVRLLAKLRRLFPFTRCMDHGLGMARATRSIALGLRTGTTSAFSDSLPNVVSSTNQLRPKLRQLVKGVQIGMLPHDAARSAGLDDVFVNALRMVAHGTDVDQALGHAAEYYEAIAYRWWHMLAEFVNPVVTLILATAVGYVVLAMYLPLISLINAVMD